MSELEPEAIEQIEPVSEAEGDETEAQTFDAEYVAKLRAEAAEHRTEAKSAIERGDSLFELLLARSIEQATNGVLIDPSDLPTDGDYLGEDGFPDLLKIRAAAEALADAKPYLSRPRGDISQGARATTESASFGDLIRGALR